MTDHSNIQPRKLRIGVDLDGVMYDFVGVFTRWVHMTTGRPLVTLPYPKVWNFPVLQWGFTDKEFNDMFIESILHGTMFRKSSPLPGSLEGMRALHEAGHEIVIVTNRKPDGAQTTAKESTLAWLRFWDVPYDEIIFTGNKQNIVLDVAIDDYVVNYQAMDKVGTNVVLLSQPWNAHCTGRRVDSWPDFVSYVDDLALVSI